MVNERRCCFSGTEPEWERQAATQIGLEHRRALAHVHASRPSGFRRDQRRSKEAGDLLAQIYDWLIEGLDTADPKKA